MLASLLAKLRRAGAGGALARGSSVTLLIKVAGLGLTMVLHLCLTRFLLTVEEYGVYVYATTLVRTTALLTTLGFARSALRFIPEYTVRQEWGALAGFLRRVPRLVVLASFVVGGLAVLGVWAGKPPTIAPYLTVALLTAALLPARSLLEVATSSLRGFHKIIVPFGAEAILHPILLLAAFGTLYLLNFPCNSVLAMTVNVIGTGAVVVLLYVLLAKATPREAKGATPDVSLTRYWIAASIPFLLLTSSNVLAKQVDLFMVGALLGPGAAGVYAVASRIVMFLSLPLNSVTAMLAPVVSQLHADGKHEELQRAVTSSTRLTFGLTLFGGLVVAVLGKWILAAFGEAYVGGLACLYVLILGQLVNAASGSVGLLMAMTGHQLEAALVVGGSVLLNVGLNLVLVPQYGIVGAAIATAIALSAWNLLLVARVRRTLGIRTLVH